MVARRSAAFSSSAVGVSPSRNLCSISSSFSATVSISCIRNASAFFFSSAGTGSSEYSAPRVSSCHRMAFISIRSTTPLNLASAPIGICVATGRAPSRLRIVSITCSKSAPALSILFTKQMRGTLYLSPCRHTVSVCGCTPDTESNSATAPSSTRSERSTSAVKSTCPGVSIILIRISFQMQVVAADVIVIPRSCSCSM